MPRPERTGGEVRGAGDGAIVAASRDPHTLSQTLLEPAGAAKTALLNIPVAEGGPVLEAFTLRARVTASQGHIQADVLPARKSEPEVFDALDLADADVGQWLADTIQASLSSRTTLAPKHQTSGEMVQRTANVRAALPKSSAPAPRTQDVAAAVLAKHDRKLARKLGGRR